MSTPQLAIEEAERAQRLGWITGGQIRPRPAAVERRLRLTILDRYLLTELAAPACFAMAAFTLFLLVNSFFLAADYIINKGVPFNLVARYIVLQLPGFMYLILPFAALFGILLGIGRLAGDNEITAMRTHGISLKRIAIAAFAGGTLLTLLAFFINEAVAPRSYRKAQELFRQIAYHSSQPIIQPYQFIRTEDGRHVLFVESVDSASGAMRNIELFTIGAGFWPESLTARSGRQENGRIVLEDGIQTEYGPDGLVIKQQHFKTLEFPLGDTNLLYSGAQSPFEMNSRDLSKQIRMMKLGGADVTQLEMTLNQKFAMPVACLVGVLVALPLSIRFGRRGRGVAAMLAVVVLFVYYLIMAATNALGKNGAIPPALAAWLPNLVVGGTGLGLLFFEER